LLIVDSHAHVFSPNEKKYKPIKNPSRPPEGAGTFEHLQREMSAAGVKAVCAVQVSGFYGFDNSYVVDLADENRTTLAGIVTLDPNRAETPRRLAGMMKSTWVRGVRSIPTKNGRINEPSVRALWTAARDAGLTVNLQIDYELADDAARLIEDFPDLMIALDHSLKLESGERVRDTLTALKLLSRYDNVHAKLSNIANGPEGCADGYPCTSFHGAIMAVIKMFGPSRCAWGSHFPLERYSPKLSYAESLRIYSEELPLSSSARADILGGTANRLWFGGRLSE